MRRCPGPSTPGGPLPSPSGLRASERGYATRVSFFRHAAREYVIHRLARGRRPPRGGLYPMRRPRGGFYGVRSRPARPRSRVRVGGCCLPIPLGMVVTLGAGTRLALRLRGR